MSQFSNQPGNNINDQLAEKVLGEVVEGLIKEAMRPPTPEEIREEIRREEERRAEERRLEEEERLKAEQQQEKAREAKADVEAVDIDVDATAAAAQLDGLKGTIAAVAGSEAATNITPGQSPEEIQVQAEVREALELLQSQETQVQIAMAGDIGFKFNEDIRVVPLNDEQLEVAGIPEDIAITVLPGGRVQLKEDVEVLIKNGGLTDPLDEDRIIRFDNAPGILAAGTVLNLSGRKNEATQYQPEPSPAELYSLAG